ncbi:MAG: hypothetical protein PW845_14200 [Pseudomonas sp.]|uniref:hypothetical protein n=1 Tax=Pseudomonas abieticivorans TaxID=2931382 RepID=UPI0020C11A34|nr:hypothetical protein [Pseudomonas sp. PIA16]MDE1166495.1 hypothetical protein [Pseudomonas sp.]
MRSIHILALLGALLLAGCSSGPMQVSPNQALDTAAQDQAQVVFMRSAFTAKAINASLYDVTDGHAKFVGILPNGYKVAYTTTPGKHTFMVVSEAADFLEANLEGGKTYYSLVTPRMGMWKARFSLWPIRNDATGEYNTRGSDFAGWQKDTQLIVNTPKSQAWFEANKASVSEKQADYWPVWQKKSAKDLAERTLNPQDGL